MLFLYLFVLFLVIPVHNIIQILDCAKYLHFRFVLPIGIERRLHFFIVSSHVAIFDQTSNVIFIILNLFRYVAINYINCMQFLWVDFVAGRFFLVLVVGRWKLSIIIAIVNIIMIEFGHYFILRITYGLSNRIIPF